MTCTTLRRSVVAGALLALAACAGRDPGPSAARPAPDDAVLRAAARADSVRSHYNQADVDFMAGMIHHHAQALDMCHMAPSHDASESVATLCSRILNAQRDEIALMQRWLRERGEPVPEVGGMGGHGGHGAPLMAGMLSPEQMERLDAARGEEWDRLFLTFMIQHHQGALTMVEELFDSYGAGQGDAIFKIASDIGADQATEIDRMQRMLEALVFGSGAPA